MTVDERIDAVLKVFDRLNAEMKKESRFMRQGPGGVTGDAMLRAATEIVLKRGRE